jgi:hypothetical protein
MRTSSFRDYEKRAHCPRPPLSAYLEDYLTPAQRELTERHILGCERCGAQLAEMRQAMEQVGGLGRATIPAPMITAALSQVDPLAVAPTASAPAAQEPELEAPPLLWHNGTWRPAPVLAEEPAPAPPPTEAAFAPPEPALPPPAPPDPVAPWAAVEPEVTELEPEPAAVPFWEAPPPAVAVTPDRDYGERPWPPEAPESPFEPAVGAGLEQHDDARALVFAEANASPTPSSPPADDSSVPLFIDPMTRGVPSGRGPQRERTASQLPARMAAVVAAALVLGGGVYWSVATRSESPSQASKPTSAVAGATSRPTATATAPAVATPSPTPVATPAPPPPPPVNLKAIRIKANGADTPKGFNARAYEVVLDVSTLTGKAPSFTVTQEGNTLLVSIPGFNPSGVPAFQAPTSAPIVSVVPGDGVVTITLRQSLPYESWSLDAPPNPRIAIDIIR